MLWFGSYPNNRCAIHLPATNSQGEAMTKRKFHETIIEVRVLSEEPFVLGSLEDMAFAIRDGDCVGSVEEKGRRELDGKQAADALYDVGSEPGFFMLDDGGDIIEAVENEIEDEE